MYTTGEGERCGMGFLVMESFTDSLSVKSKVGKGTTVLMRKILKP
jgi:stage II sporulation protein AB (anti-sigma F factor)